MHRAGLASTRRRPVNSALGLMKRPAGTHVALFGLVNAVLSTAHADVEVASSKPWLSCSPARVRTDVTLVVHKSVARRLEFGVWSPSGDFYFLHSCDEALRTDSLRKMSCESFAKKSALRLRTSTLLAPNAASGYEKRSAVFTLPGKYVFLLAENLETENTSEAVARCNVQYLPSAK